MRNHIKCAFFGLILILCSAVEAPADDLDQYSQQFSDCVTKSIKGKVALSECVDDEFNVQTAALKHASTQLMSNLGPNEQKQFITIQKQWFSYMEASCGFMSDFEEYGMMGKEAANMCYLEATAFRVIQVENYLARF